MSSDPLAHAAPSVDALVGRLVGALAARDREALARLRVSEREYRTIIVPGHVEPGRPPQRLPDEASRFFWEMLDTRSRYSAEALLAEFGGQRYRLKGVRFARGTRRYAGYTAHRQLRLILEDGGGAERELRTGSIAEVRGRYKFVSFVRD